MANHRIHGARVDVVGSRAEFSRLRMLTTLVSRRLGSPFTFQWA